MMLLNASRLRQPPTNEAAAVSAGMQEKHDIPDAIFLVDHAHHLAAAL